MPSNTKAADRNGVNYVGSFGAMAQSPLRRQSMRCPGDLETARLFGQRGVVTAQFRADADADGGGSGRTGRQSVLKRLAGKPTCRASSGERQTIPASDSAFRCNGFHLVGDISGGAAVGCEVHHRWHARPSRHGRPSATPTESGDLASLKGLRAPSLTTLLVAASPATAAERLDALDHGGDLLGRVAVRFRQFAADLIGDDH